MKQWLIGKLWLIGFLGALLLAHAAAQDDLLSRVQAAGVLRVGNTQASPPWNFVDENNALVGFDVDVANELAKRMGIAKVEFVASKFPELIAGIQANKFDIAINGQTPTEERKQVLDFSVPYQAIGVAVFTKPDQTETITSLEDLAGKRVAVTAGSTQEKFLRENVPTATPVTYENATLGLTDIAFGRTDAGLYNRYVGAYLAQENNLQVAPAEFTLGIEYNAMSFAKDQATFKAAVDEALQSMIDDGTLSELSLKWLGGQDMVPDLKAAPQ
jgi:L-cystine transport system substrate-binding protein